MRILIAEDERKIAAFVRKGLFEQGFNVTVCYQGDEALSLATSESFDAIVLDILMPGLDGLTVLRRLREAHNAVPVLLLTARDGVPDRVEGLNSGADDYLTKPFSVDELVARLRAISRRKSGDRLNVLQIDDLILNLAEREVCRAGKKIDLTHREFDLLEHLMRSPGRVFTRTLLCEQVWAYHFDPGTNVVDVAIQRLRRKIDDGFGTPLLHTVRGVGYTLKNPT